MAQNRAADRFTQPVRQILIMLCVLGLVGAGAWLAAPALLPVFQSNVLLNGFIAFVFVVGVLATFWQAIQISAGVRWIGAYTAGRDAGGNPPRLLAPLAALLRSRSNMNISASSSRSILDSVATRIDEAREITRYITSLLIFLGLLGTFYGLATTVPAVVETIRGLAPREGDTAVAVFERLMTGLEAQLGGMGVAFASSLLGLAGSLVVGLLELFAGHGQNRFYRELEEWLSTITTLGFEADSDDGGAAMMAALANRMADQVAQMREMLGAEVEARAISDENLAQLVVSIGALTERMSQGGAEEEALERVAQGQERMVEILAENGGLGGLDPESRMRLRSIDVQLLRLLEEISAGRQESMAELRGDIANLGRAMRGGGAGPMRASRAASFRQD